MKAYVNFFKPLCKFVFILLCAILSIKLNLIKNKTTKIIQRKVIFLVAFDHLGGNSLAFRPKFLGFKPS
jgi:hypothetical protein